MTYIKFKYFASILLLICSWCVHAQPQSYIEDLELRLKKEEKNIKKVQILNELATAYFYKAPKTAIEYNQKAIDLIPKDYYYGLGNLYITMGSIYGYTNELPKALLYLDSAAVFYTQADSLEGVASVYGNISNVYFIMGSNSEASEYLYKSIQINEQLNNKEGLAYNFMAMTSIHILQKEFELAITAGRKALENSPLLNDPISIGNNHLNIGIAYSELKNIDSALLYMNQTFSYFKKGNYWGGIAKTYSEKGLLYIKQQQLDSAKQYIYKALELEEYITEQKQKLEFQSNLAIIYLHEKKYAKSIALYDTVRKIAHSIPNRQTEKIALLGLINNYKALQQYENVAKYLDTYIALKDTIFNIEKQRQIKELEIQYKTKKKEQEITLLSKDRDIQALKALRSQQWTYSIITVLSLVLLISFLLLRQNKFRTTQQTAQLKHRLLRNQMNPHFIFNALTAIQSYVYENNPKEAGLYLSSFAKLVRAILENSRKEYISLEKEIQWLENYLKLQLLRFDHQFEYHIDIDPELDIHGLLIPPMLTQPFIENALEHGIKNIDYKGKINIQFRIEKAQYLQINVKDNGLGINATTTKAVQEHHSLATVITKERLSFLNKKQANNINFTIKPNEPSGTIVSFIIPLNYT